MNGGRKYVWKFKGEKNAMRWEYRSLLIGRPHDNYLSVSDNDLNILGQDGWELVGILSVHSFVRTKGTYMKQGILEAFVDDIATTSESDVTACQLIFKRPKP
jgi:hypothetical protein